MEAKICAECGNQFTGRRKSRICSLQCYFWSCFDKSAGPDGCWIWKAYICPNNGYGVVNAAVAGKRTTAHRHSYKLTHGDPGPLSVLHACDCRKCGNPRHLWAGTQKENLMDAHKKGRPIMARPGEDHPFAKLTSAAVREIRSTTASARVLAERYGVTRATVQAARRGATWRHVA